MPAEGLGRSAAVKSEDSGSENAATVPYGADGNMPGDESACSDRFLSSGWPMSAAAGVRASDCSSEKGSSSTQPLDKEAHARSKNAGGALRRSRYWQQFINWDAHGCLDCDLTFCDNDGLYYHMVTVHPLHGFYYRCRMCGLVVSKRWSLKKHLKRVHRKETCEAADLVRQMQVLAELDLRVANLKTRTAELSGQPQPMGLMLMLTNYFV